VNPAVVLEEGAQLTASRTVSIGHVTSSYHSAVLGRSIALALVSGGRSLIGTKLRVPLPGGVEDVTVTAPIFHDPTGVRMTGPITINAGTVNAGRFAQTAAAAPFAPPPAAYCAEAELAIVSATGKFIVRTREHVAPVLRADTGGGHTVLWLGPDEYLVFSNESPAIATDSIVEVSHRTVGIRVSGLRAGWCLNAFCALDLDTIPESGCTRTLFGKAEIILWRLGEAAFHIEAARSYAAYVWALLEEARREFLPSPTPC